MGQDTEPGAELPIPEAESYRLKRIRELREQATEQFAVVKSKIRDAKERGDLESLKAEDRKMNLGRFDLLGEDRDILAGLMQDIGVEDDASREAFDILDNSPRETPIPEGYIVPTKYPGVRFEVYTIPPRVNSQWSGALDCTVAISIDPWEFDTNLELGSAPKELAR